MDLESQIGDLSEAVELLQKSVSCSICLDIMVNPTSTKCGHSFCHDCIMTVVNKNRMASCPLCNCKINRRTVKENEKAKIMIERVINVINSVGKDIGMDITGHAKVPKSTQEAMLRSPKVQRVLRQSKLEPKSVWQKSDFKCNKSKFGKEDAKGKQQEKPPKPDPLSRLSSSSPNGKEEDKEREREKTPEHISVSQVLPLSPPATDEKISYSIHKNVGDRKKRVEEWLDKAFEAVTPEDQAKSEQLTVVADVHKTEGSDSKSAPQQRVRCYKISKTKAMVFTDADEITVDSHTEENNKKRKIEASVENSAEIQNSENAASDPYVFIGSQKTPVKPRRKSSRQKDKENKSAPASIKEETQKKKPKIMSAKPLPVRYNASQTLSIDIYDEFDKLVVTSNKTQPTACEEHSDSDDTVFLFRTPKFSDDPCDEIKAAETNKLEGSDGHDSNKKRIAKTGSQRRARSKSSGKSRTSVKPEAGLQNIKHMLEQPKANVANPLSPSKKVNQIINSVSLADDAIKDIPAVKSLILEEAAKQEMQLLEKENLSDVIEPATPVNVSKLNSTSGTKSPGWSRISKSKKEFDKLKKRECAALDVSGGVATKRNKITDCFKKVSSDTLDEPVPPPVEDENFDIPISAVESVAEDCTKTRKLDPEEITVNELPEVDNSLRSDLSLSKKKGFFESFSDIDTLDSPGSRKRKIHIKSLIALLSNENESSKVTENTSPKDPEVPSSTEHDQNELELKEQIEANSNEVVEEHLKKNSVEIGGFKAKTQQEIDVYNTPAPSETKVSLKNEGEDKEPRVVPTAEVVKANMLSYSATMEKQTRNEEPKSSKDLVSCVLKTAEEFKEKKRYVAFVKRGRFNRFTRRISFILLGKLTSKKRSFAEVEEEDAWHKPQENKAPSKPLESPDNTCVETSITTNRPLEEKHTLEFVGTEDSQTCNVVVGSSETIDFPSIIPLPHKRSADAAFCSPSQADDILTQKFLPPPPAKSAEDKNHNGEQKSGSNSGSKMTLSQFSNATTVRYESNRRDSLENSLETCNYSPDRSLTLLELDSPNEIKDKAGAPSEKLSNEVSSGNDSVIRMPFRSKTVNRQLDFVPELTDPALDASLEMHTKDPRKPFKRIRSPSSSDSDSETLVPQTYDVHKRAKCDNGEEDVEVINLISSQENNAASKADSETDLPNSAELLAKVMANIDADLAVKQNRTSGDCGESDMEQDRDTPIMFTPIEYYGSQIANTGSTVYQPNSASSEALILGTLQQENAIEIKPKTPAVETRSEVPANISPQVTPVANKTHNGDCESDEEIVQPTPSKDDSANSRNANKTNWEPQELRSMSVGVFRDVFKEPEDFVKHSETVVEKSSSAQLSKTDIRSSLANPLSTNRDTGPAAVDKPNSVQQLKVNAQKMTEAAQVEKPNFGERPTRDFQPTSKLSRAVCKTPEVPKKAAEQVKPCFVCSGLPASMIAQVKSLANTVNAEFSNTFTPNTTHLILKDAEDNLAYKTLKYLYAVVKKIWVVSFSWVNDSLRARRLLPEDDYEMLDSSGENGPYRARNSTDLLLTNFEFCCMEPYTDITKDQLEELLKESGASVVNSPEEIKFRSGIHNMILVQMEARSDEEVQCWWDTYSVITVAHEWVLDSIGRCRVIPIWPYLMTDIEDDHLQALGYPDVLLSTDELEPESQA